MSDENAAPEATNDAASQDVTIKAPAATPDAPADETLLEKLEDVVGGILGDHPKSAAPAEHEAERLRSGESVITREELDEIEKRSAVSDIRTLVGACRRLLDELEA